MRPSFPDIYMRFAADLSRRSTCERSQVGCVITTSDFRQVVAVGFNGGAAGQSNECERIDGVVVPGQCGHIHAEENAIIACAHVGPKVVFCTLLPCKMCAKKLVNLQAAKGKIEAVYYGQTYRLTDSMVILQEAGIEVKYCPPIVFP
jgi:dCMP deaminase